MKRYIVRCCSNILGTNIPVVMRTIRFGAETKEEAFVIRELASQTFPRFRCSLYIVAKKKNYPPIVTSVKS